MRQPDIKQLDQLFRTYCTKKWRSVAVENTTTLAFKKGETIFKEGQRMDNMYMVDKGRVKVYTNYSKDVEVVIRFATDGQTLGHRGLGADHVFPVTAEALSETTVNILPLSVFEDLLRNNNEFCYYFMLFISEELRRSEQRKKNLLKMSVLQRVAEAVKVNVESFGFDKNDSTLLSYTISRKDISSLANTTYESTVRSLSDLQSEKILQIEGKKLRVLNLEKLCQFIAC
ncbi:MAG: Crp/Fnr family transcriptional regulator [Flavobacteriales bacterium]|nr:Crp/Fnr family transcriptional regulator [Flavobacteriales bacterium]